MKNIIYVMTLVLITACANTKKEDSSSAEEKSAMKASSTVEKSQVQLKSANMKVKGEVSFEETDEGLMVVSEITGLKPNSVHGMHVHENGKCEGPNYESAGGHLNPDNTSHGSPTAPEKHPGDFGNVVADAKGKARKELLLPDVDLETFQGKAIILHAKADDLVSQPSGNAGDRLACGLIQ